jgi:hypothetical protein
MKVFSVRGPQPLRKPPEDFQGKTFGTLGADAGGAVIAALGGTARAMSAAEVAGALTAGELHGQESLWSQTYGSKLYEVQDWISVSDHLYRGFLVVIGAEFWNALPADVRDELTAVVDQATARAREYAAQETAEDRRRIEESGTAIVLGLTSAEREDWRKATADLEKRLGAQIGDQLLAEVQELLRLPAFVPPVAADSSDLAGSEELELPPAGQEAQGEEPADRQAASGGPDESAGGDTGQPADPATDGEAEAPAVAGPSVGSATPSESEPAKRRAPPPAE